MCNKFYALSFSLGGLIIITLGNLSGGIFLSLSFRIYLRLSITSSFGLFDKSNSSI